jgi:hypothetical protein
MGGAGWDIMAIETFLRGKNARNDYGDSSIIKTQSDIKRKDFMANTTIINQLGIRVQRIKNEELKDLAVVTARLQSFLTK